MGETGSRQPIEAVRAGELRADSEETEVSKDDDGQCVEILRSLAGGRRDMAYNGDEVKEAEEQNASSGEQVPKSLEPNAAIELLQLLESIVSSNSKDMSKVKGVSGNLKGSGVPSKPQGFVPLSDLRGEKRREDSLVNLNRGVDADQFEPKISGMAHVIGAHTHNEYRSDFYEPRDYKDAMIKVYQGLKVWFSLTRT